MAAIESSLSLTELVQALQEQQSQYAESTAAIAAALSDQQLQQSEHAKAIASTLEHISGLLSSLLGGFAPLAAKAVVAVAPPKKPKKTVAAKPAAKSTSKSSTPRRRGSSKYATTGIESVINFIAEHGSPNTKELTAHWQSEKRGGKVDHTLSQLVKQKKLKRVANPDGRGSRYVVA